MSYKLKFKKAPVPAVEEPEPVIEESPMEDPTPPPSSAGTLITSELHREKGHEARLKSIFPVLSDAERRIDRICERHGWTWALAQANYNTDGNKKVIMVGVLIEGSGDRREDALESIAQYLEERFGA